MSGGNCIACMITYHRQQLVAWWQSYTKKSKKRKVQEYRAACMWIDETIKSSREQWYKIKRDGGLLWCGCNYGSRNAKSRMKPINMDATPSPLALFHQPSLSTPLHLFAAPLSVPGTRYLPIIPPWPPKEWPTVHGFRETCHSVMLFH